MKDFKQISLTKIIDLDAEKCSFDQLLKTINKVYLKSE